MEKIFNFLRKSNRYKHIIGGFIVALYLLILSMGHYFCAAFAVFVAASCLEWKDKQHGCTWDWIDWICTLAGGLMGILAYLIIF